MQAMSGSGEVDLDTDGKRLARLLVLLLERGLGGGLVLAVLRAFLSSALVQTLVSSSLRYLTAHPTWNGLADFTTS